jgi:hypothetical protein
VLQVSTATFAAVRRTGFSSAGLPILGGLATGCFAVFFPEVLYQVMCCRLLLRTSHCCIQVEMCWICYIDDRQHSCKW